MILKSWTPEEDRILFNERSKGRSFGVIADMLPGRSDRACHGRYERIVNTGGPDRHYPRHDAWAPHEDEALVAGRRAGLSYPEICHAWLPGRTVKAARNRMRDQFKAIDQQIKAATPAIEDMPKRVIITGAVDAAYQAAAMGSRQLLEGYHRYYQRNVQRRAA